MLVALIPSAAGVLYLYWGSIFAVDESVGQFLQERAENVANLVDEQLELHAGYALLARDAISSGTDPRSLPPDIRTRFDVIDIVPLDEVERTDGVRPGILQSVTRAIERNKTTSVFVDELKEPSGKSTMVFGAISESPTTRTAVICSIAASRMLNFLSTERAGGQALVDIFSNRGHFVGASSHDEHLNRFISAHYGDFRQKLSGWVHSPRRAPDPYLVGFSTPKWLRIKQREAATSVDWVVMAQMGLSDLLQLFSQFLWRSFIFWVILALLLFVLSFRLARRFVRPIRTLHASVDRLAQGDLSARVKLDTDDELEDLAHAFNSMAEALNKSRESLQLEIDQVAKNAQQIALMNNLAKSIVAAFNYELLFASLHPQLRALVHYDGLAVVLFDGSDRARVYGVEDEVFHSPSDNAPHIRLFCEEHLVAATSSDSRVPSGNFSKETNILNSTFQQFTLIPLRADRALMGTMVLARISDVPFSSGERKTLSQVGQILALAIGNIKLYTRTKDFAEQLELKVRERTQELEMIHQRMLHTERFAATGTLAANIAHEINNPLGIVKNYVRLLRESISKSGAQGDELLIVVDEELDRIARIVRGLLDFYRPSKVRHEPVQLNDQIQSLLALMEGTLRSKNINVITELDPALPVIQTSPDHMRQILLNLLKNSEDAISSDGTITIRTLTRAQRNAQELILEITDTGSGIAPDDLTRIFEPFFTTKKDGHGTGLGLSVTYGIVRNWDGEIEVESSVGRGTTFRVRLPVPAVDVLTGKN